MYLFLYLNSEEVAFYDGNKKERYILMGAFNTLKDHLRSFIRFKFFEGIVDNMIAKCMYCGQHDS